MDQKEQKLTLKETITVFKILGDAFKKQIPIDLVLKRLVSTFAKSKKASVIDKIRKDIKTVGYAEAFKGIIPDNLTQAILSAEDGGNLDKVWVEIRKFFELQLSIMKLFRNALVMPSFVLAMVVLAVHGYLIFLIPMLAEATHSVVEPGISQSFLPVSGSSPATRSQPVKMT